MSQYLETVIAKLENNANQLNQETQATVRALQVLQALNEADGALVVTAAAENVKVIPAVEVSNERAVAMMLAALKTIIINVKSYDTQQAMLSHLADTLHSATEECTIKPEVTEVKVDA